VCSGIEKMSFMRGKGEWCCTMARLFLKRRSEERSRDCAIGGISGDRSEIFMATRRVGTNPTQLAFPRKWTRTSVRLKNTGSE